METCKLAISTMSLGRCYAGHSLAHRLEVAHEHGYQGIELFYEDLLDAASRLSSTTTGAATTSFSSGVPSQPNPSFPAQLAAATQISRLCQDLDLQIISLQPFSHYDGLLDRSQHTHLLHTLLPHWISLAHALNTPTIQVPASFLPADRVTTDTALIISDLRALADAGARATPPIRFAYEALCWSTRVDTWEASWAVVSGVDRDNFGLCLDSFNIAGRIYADPARLGCKAEDAENAVRESVARLVDEVDVSKVFYVQIVDAQRLDEPLVEGHPYYNPEQPCRMSWSRNCRLFYGEEDKGGFLPIAKIAKAFFHGIGYRGWVSLELFNRRMADEGAEVPEELARRGAVSWRKLVRDFGLPVDAEQRETSAERGIRERAGVGALL